MFFWMIIFYCFFIYCARWQGRLDYTGSDELNSDSNSNSNKELFDSMDKSSAEHYSDPNWSDLPGNIYHKDNR